MGADTKVTGAVRLDVSLGPPSVGICAEAIPCVEINNEKKINARTLFMESGRVQCYRGHLRVGPTFSFITRGDASPIPTSQYNGIFPNGVRWDRCLDVKRGATTPQASQAPACRESRSRPSRCGQSR